MRSSSFTSARARASSAGRRNRSSRSSPGSFGKDRTGKCSSRRDLRTPKRHSASQTRPAIELGTLGPAILESRPLTLPELRALIARAALFVGGDSGPLHIAATTSVPIVELLGPTLAERSLSLARSALLFGNRRPGRAALPSVSSAHVRAGRLQVPDEHRRRTASSRQPSAHCARPAERTGTLRRRRTNVEFL